MFCVYFTPKMRHGAGSAAQSAAGGGRGGGLRQAPGLPPDAKHLWSVCRLRQLPLPAASDSAAGIPACQGFERGRGRARESSGGPETLQSGCAAGSRATGSTRSAAGIPACQRQTNREDADKDACGTAAPRGAEAAPYTFGGASLLLQPALLLNTTYHGNGERGERPQKSTSHARHGNVIDLVAVFEKAVGDRNLMLAASGRCVEFVRVDALGLAINGIRPAEPTHSNAGLPARSVCVVWITPAAREDRVTWGGGPDFIVVRTEKLSRHPQLPLVAQAVRPLRHVPRILQGRQQYRRQDSDHDEKLIRVNLCCLLRAGMRRSYSSAKSLSLAGRRSLRRITNICPVIAQRFSARAFSGAACARRA